MSMTLTTRQPIFTEAPTEVPNLQPSINVSNLYFALVYADGHTDDARLLGAVQRESEYVRIFLDDDGDAAEELHATASLHADRGMEAYHPRHEFALLAEARSLKVRLEAEYPELREDT